MTGADADGVTPAALRQRRSRAHRRGDHSLCLKQSCSRAGQSPAAVEDAVAAVPEPLADAWGAGGAQLWDELHGSVPRSYLPMLREACRIVDRLDRMHAILQGRRDWLRISTLDLGENVKVRITLDGVLAEARQQATTLLATLKELRSAAASKAGAGGAPRTGGLSALADELAARRRAPAG